MIYKNICIYYNSSYFMSEHSSLAAMIPLTKQNHFGNNDFVFLLCRYLVEVVATKLGLQAQAEPKLHQPPK